jgi:outer membrane protein assembly factor BamB
MGLVHRKVIVFFLIASPLLTAQSEVSKDRDQAWFTGDPVWRQALGGAIVSLPDAQAQSMVAALDGGNIRAYSTSGKPLWSFSAKGRIAPFVTRSREGTSYFSRTTGTLFAVNRAGRELWQRNPGGPLTAKVVPGWDGRLFVPTEKKISCYTASGSLLWDMTLNSPFITAPKLDHKGGIFFILENRELWRIDPFSNARQWTLPDIPAVVLSTGSKKNAAVATLYKDGSVEIYQINDKQISANADIKSVLKLPQQPLCAISNGDIIAAVLKNGQIVYASQDEAKILWTSNSHIFEVLKNNGKAELEAEMIFDERGIYVLSKDGASGFAKDGRRLWFTILQNAASIPAFGDDGILYSGGKDWILYAYKVEDRALPPQKQIYGPAPEGLYGTGSPPPPGSFEFTFGDEDAGIKLKTIISGVKSGKVGTDELKWMSYLMTIASGRYAIQYRIQALNLLGQIGSIETIPWLVNFFNREFDETIKAAAVYAIGNIGTDTQGLAIKTFLDTITFKGGIIDGQTLVAITKATGAICRFSGPPLSETGIKILILLSANSLSLVRRQAIREIALLGTI